MLENLHFTYDGKSSRDFGVVLVNPSGGLYKEQFLPNRKIVETKVAGRHNPFLHRVDDDPLSFSLHIYLEEWEERNNLRQISRWLYQPYYKELRFESNPDIIYYAMIEGESELTHNGLFQGYISLTVRMNSPYCYSKQHELNYVVDNFNKTSVYNNGDLPMRINMEIKKTIDDGEVGLVFSNSEDALIILDLKVGEITYMDSDVEIVTSSLESEGKYPKLRPVDHWVDIEPEETVELEFHGNYEIKLKYQYAYLNTDIEMIGKVGGFC